MPRRVSARLGESAMQKVEKLRWITNKQLRELAKVLDLKIGRRRQSKIVWHVKAAGRHYGRMAKGGIYKYSRAEAAAALRCLIRLDDITYYNVLALNIRAQFALLTELVKSGSRPAGSQTPFEALQRGVYTNEQIRDAASNAIVVLGSTKGPDPNPALDECVHFLCKFYEELTSETCTLSNKDTLRAYCDAPQSRAGKFISWCFDHIDPDLPPSRISNAIRKYISCRSKKAARPI